MHFTKEKGITKWMASYFFFVSAVALFISLLFLLFSFNISSTFQFCLCECGQKLLPRLTAQIFFNCITLHCMHDAYFIRGPCECILTEWQDDFYRSVFVVFFILNSSIRRFRHEIIIKHLLGVFFHGYLHFYSPCISLTFMVKCNCDPCILFKNAFK